MKTAPDLFSYRKHWAHKLGTAPELPISRAEMDVMGWDSCDVIIVTGDAYVDHPSFGMAVIGRLLEAHGFRVGIIDQPDWTSAEDFQRLGRPNLFFGITAGNMDSMVNRYTADRRLRSDDAYTPNAEAGRRPDRSVTVYAQRAREAYKGVPVVIGGIEASLRRIAHFDYWSEKVRRSVLMDAKADLLIFGNGERAVVEVAHRLAGGESITEIRDLRGTAFLRRDRPEGWTLWDSSQLDAPGPLSVYNDPYETDPACDNRPETTLLHGPPRRSDRATTVVRLPAYEQVRDDPVLYAHASRVFHLETNPGNARALVQAHGDRDVWLNPPPIPLTSAELDQIYELPFTRKPHSRYEDAKLPAWEMIRHSINILRGCFGGCTFCSITEHEGRIIQNRSEDSILREIGDVRDRAPGFTGTISDLGGPTANMWRMACKDRRIEAACRKLSCVYPDICRNLNTDHEPLIRLYRKARAVPGIKRILIASGLRYDLAVRSPAYIRELVTHHVGGYLKIAPEHTEAGPLSKMMKPGIGTYDRFKALFDKYSKEAGKEQYLIPYFISAHPGTSDADMLKLALWLKRNGFRLDQVQAFLPTPLAIASAMYHSERNPLKRVTRHSERVSVVRGQRQRRLQKALLRYHDPENWPLLRKALQDMGRADLIGNGKRHLVPSFQPAGTGGVAEGQRRPSVPTGSSMSRGRSHRKPSRRR
ncbi:YgiQ family radical SAM protein [Thiorhodococcus mannitoliphagus]|uniref:YgiQ family radical SAM protein n=1 Tax=Thiorhodococcus mannitoliphagus TaxID=329406 RepID=A0A6P1E1L0_9GAMM|nr:YgiQ family radical SAM protein [Thiorhodococcus mannitoliphagus]NEX23211.1 YgiQ family radical SAM protein [Thiorhodococcus mannitoliphagus]